MTFLANSKLSLQMAHRHQCRQQKNKLIKVCSLSTSKNMQLSRESMDHHVSILFIELISVRKMAAKSKRLNFKTAILTGKNVSSLMIRNHWGVRN